MTEVTLNKILEARFVRFLLTGGLNTAITYAMYLLLLEFLPYLWSYSISYVCGILFAFVMSRFFVFKEHQGLKTVLFFPLIYLTQYLLGALIVWFWVKKLMLPATIAPLIAIIISLPITFILSKLAFVRRTPTAP
ncbi:GtrA family protein [Pseudomonas quasicaspiana]|nr:GtrA family protein [Pseudomonas quasicaspiana]